MTKSEFKSAMLRGLGRCVYAVQQEPEKYRDIVLWACTRDIAYDTQCEGTRCWYVYTMVNAYSDKEPFVAAAVEALKKHKPRYGWDMAHLSQLLMFFAEDGHDGARQALEEKYRERLEALLCRSCRPNGVFHELSEFEELGMILAVDRASTLRVIRDLGRLYRETNYLYDGEFMWFYSDKAERYRKTLEKAAMKDVNIADFLERERKDYNAQKQEKTKAPADLNEFRLSRRLRRAEAETVEDYARAYREQTDPETRAEALEAFSLCPYPDNPQPIIEDTAAPNEALQSAAWRALENLRHPAVRRFALENAAQGVHTCENFSILCRNYQPRDAELMERFLRRMVAEKDWDSLHGAGMSIFDTFRKGSGIPHLKHLLPLLYEYTPCSCCRENALRYMARHRMLTKEVLQECCYDSSYHIRRFAEKRMKDKKKP